jgi:hypothetical protein
MWALALLAGSFFIGCTKIETGQLPPVIPGGDKALVIMSVHMPQPTVPEAVSRAQTALETRISEVRVLVFEDAGHGYVYSYYVNGTGVTGSGSQTRFQAMLSAVDAPVKLMIVANANSAFADYAPHPGTAETDVRRQLNKRFTPEAEDQALPMYGEVLLPAGINVSETYALPVTVLRGIARVDVVKELNAGSSEFILEEVYAFRVNDGIQLIPEFLLGGDSPKVNAPSVPDEAAPLADPVTKAVTGGTAFIGPLYLPEAAAAVTNTEKIKQATAIVIGGRFGGGDSPVTYYRADFNSGIEGHPFGQILRNHRYIFKIRSVSREGWPTPGQAAENLSSSIVVEVQPWEDFSSEMYLGDDRFGISSREISLRYVRNRERSLNVESTYVYQIQWLVGGNPAGDATSDTGVAVSNDNFDAWIADVPGGGEHISRIVFRTRRDNHLGDVLTDTLRITAGPWKIDVAVSQDNSAMYSERYMNVLSVEGVGNLGVDMVDPGASGLAMRRVLDAQFAPAGVIRIGGSSFTRIPNSGGYVGTSAAANLAVLTRIFGAQDVIYFPHGVSISSEVADLLVAWLAQSPHRVLILGTDSDGTNKQLRTKPVFAADGTWAFSGITTITSTYARAAVSDGADDFFNGPFGVVSADAQYARADDIAGYLPVRSGDVTPLIMANKAGYTDYMFFGVNKKNRVVYDGDAQLFMTSQMSNNNGDVTSDLDRLMANTWAWIAEQVIYGDS